jgi:hypothetical protein
MPGIKCNVNFTLELVAAGYSVICVLVDVLNIFVAECFKLMMIILYIVVPSGKENSEI